MISDEVSDEDWRRGEALWNYHRVGGPVTRADAMLVLGSNDIRVAEFGAALWMDGAASVVVASGRRTEHKGAVFARILAECGVPEPAIVTELASTNTREKPLLPFPWVGSGHAVWLRVVRAGSPRSGSL